MNTNSNHLLIKQFGLSDLDYQRLMTILKKYQLGKTFYIFGSRVKGNFQPYSDLDLVVFGSDHLALDELRDHLEESDLTIKIDLLCGEDLAESFKSVIEKEWVVLDFP